MAGIALRIIVPLDLLGLALDRIDNSDMTPEQKMEERAVLPTGGDMITAARHAAGTVRNTANETPYKRTGLNRIGRA